MNVTDARDWTLKSTRARLLSVLETWGILLIIGHDPRPLIREVREGIDDADHAGWVEYLDSIRSICAECGTVVLNDGSCKCP